MDDRAARRVTRCNFPASATVIPISPVIPTIGGRGWPTTTSRISAGTTTKRSFSGLCRTPKRHEVRDCHEKGPGGRMMLVKSFEQTCASCHRRQIEDTSLGGIPVIQSAGPGHPDARPASGHGRGRRIADTASGDLSPFMRLLLSTDERFVQQERVLRNVDLRDLRHADAAQLKAVGDYVWAIKSFLYDLTQDEAAWSTRPPGKVLDRKLDVHELSALTGDLPGELVREALSRWLPRLTVELEARRLRARRRRLLTVSGVRGEPGWFVGCAPRGRCRF